MGFRRGNFPDPAIETVFRPGLQLGGGQLKEKLIITDSTLSRLSQGALQITGHAGEVQRLEIRLQLDQCPGCH
jgi:hypothetical protein